MIIRYGPPVISVFRTAVLIACGIFAASAAFAQAPEGGNGGLFGSDLQSAARHRSLDLTMSIANGRDDDLGADEGTVATPFSDRIGGRYSDADIFLSLARAHRRFSFTGNAASVLRHYPTLNSFVGSNHSGAGTLIVDLGRYGTVRTNVDANYVSSYGFDAFSRRSAMNQEGPSSTGFGEGGSSIASTPLDSTRTSRGGMVELTRTLGRRYSFSLVSSTRYSERSVVGEQADDRTVGAQLRRTVGRDMVIQVAYNFRDGAQRLGAEASPFLSHDVQATVERQWRHSRASRTVLSLSGGPSLLQQRVTETVTVSAPPVEEVSPPPVEEEEDSPAVPEVAPSLAREDRTARLFRVVGTALLTHEMNRRWSAQLSYRRGAGMRDAVIFSNTVALGLRASLGRRVGVLLSAGYTDGDIGVATLTNRDRISFGSARLQFALARFVALYGQYFLYHYDFAMDTTQAAAYPHKLDRRGLRAGLTIWMPLQRG